LSLDGPRVVHDKFRVDRAGNGTFHKVMEAFKEVERRRQGKTTTYEALSPMTHWISQSLSRFWWIRVQDHFYGAGNRRGLPWSIKWTDLPIIEQEYEKLANFYLMRAKEGNDKRFYFYHFELNPMNPPSVLRRFTGCGAGVEYVAVNPKGDIFPVTNLTTSCHTKWVTLTSCGTATSWFCESPRTQQKTLSRMLGKSFVRWWLPCR